MCASARSIEGTRNRNASSRYDHRWAKFLPKLPPSPSVLDEARCSACVKTPRSNIFDIVPVYTRLHRGHQLFWEKSVSPKMPTGRGFVRTQSKSPVRSKLISTGTAARATQLTNM
jgi:hypothetical protein